MVRYFAYGSNMLPLRLQRRCPSARLDGLATLHGYKLEFSKIGKDGSGKATIVSSSHADAKVHGIVFHLAHHDMPRLDCFEARGKGYERLELNVSTQSAQQAQEITTYIAENIHMDDALQPFDWYLELVLRGAEYGNLPDDYRQQLAAAPARVDPDPMRMSRQEALAILAETGDPKMSTAD